MKTIIISDTHLSHHFDEGKFIFLKDLFSLADRIILNGDFWDGHITTFDAFISSKWNRLFPLLKRKGAIYLYGNHDLKKFGDGRDRLFSAEQKDSHTLMIDSTTYHIEHGHSIFPLDVDTPFSKRGVKYINILFQKAERRLIQLGSPHNIFLKMANKIIKRKLRIKKFPHWYLCGHTHYAEIDVAHKFANSGLVQFGRASYLIIDSSGLSLKRQRY